MPERDTSTGQPGTYAGPGLRGPDLESPNKPLDEIVAPVAPVVIAMVCVALLVWKSRDARRLWALLLMVVYAASLYVIVIFLRVLLIVWGIR